MENSMVLVYDGSFNGYLTSLYVAFKENIEVTDFQRSNSNQNGLFVDSKVVVTQISKAKTVWGQIEKKGNTRIRTIYFAFLSEAAGIEFMLFKHIQGLLAELSPPEIENAVTFEHRIAQLAKLVGTEKQRMESVLEFNGTDIPVYIAEIKPAYNVLPLISRYFRFKYAKHQWIIFDRKRNYGLYCNRGAVEIISRETMNWYASCNSLSNTFGQREYKFAV